MLSHRGLTLGTNVSEWTDDRRKLKTQKSCTCDIWMKMKLKNLFLDVVFVGIFMEKISKFSNNFKNLTNFVSNETFF